jgi:hypothetical protein
MSQFEMHRTLALGMHLNHQNAHEWMKWWYAGTGGDMTIDGVTIAVAAAAAGAAAGTGGAGTARITVLSIARRGSAAARPQLTSERMAGRLQLEKALAQLSGSSSSSSRSSSRQSGRLWLPVLRAASTSLHLSWPR